MLRFVSLLCFALLVAASTLTAQTNKLDSLQALLKTAKDDTAKVRLLNEVAFEQRGGDPAASRATAESAYALAMRLGDKSGAARAKNQIARAYGAQSSYAESQRAAEEALALARAAGDKRQEAAAYNRMGSVQWRQGNFDAALDFNFKALALAEETGDKAGLANTLFGLGSVYGDMGNHASALEYLRKSLALFQELGDKRSIANTINSIGNIYLQQGKYDSALVYFRRGLGIATELKAKNQMMSSLLNMGESNLRLGRLGEAQAALEEGLPLAYAIEAKDWVVFGLHLFSQLSTARGNYAEAVRYGTQAVALADSLGTRPDKRDAMKALSEAYAGKGDGLKALAIYKDYITLRDSLVNDENTKKAAYREAKYAADKKDKEILILKKDAENQALVRNSMAGGLALVGALVGVLVFSNNRRKHANTLLQSQAAEIQLANTQLQEKNIEITASRERLEVMSEVGRELTASLETETIITSLYESVSEVMDATVFGIGVVRSDKGVIEYTMAMDNGERLPPYERSLSDTNQFPVWSVGHKQSVFINDVDAEGERYIPSFRETINVPSGGKPFGGKPFYASESVGRQEAASAPSYRFGAVERLDESDYPQSLLYVPLTLHDRVLGVMSAQSYKKNAYSEAHLTMLETLANYTAIAIANAESTEEIIRQKAIVEEFNRNIQDSIRYAKRIQDAMLPSTETLNRLLPEHFIFFRPKDVVSGDFYWCKEVKGKVFVAAVDCTGHGVPGAFMSLIGNSLLNDITQRLPEPHPDTILNELHRELQTVLRQRETNNDDGMDICLCMIDKQTRIVEFAGAMNPLYAVVKGELREFKGTPEELGGREERSPVYARHTLDLSATPEGATMLYLTTDGYKDQYNEVRQRFMPKRLRPLLAEIAAKTLEEQPGLLGVAIDTHRGEMFQVDDMLVLGVRV
jgi:serine phosphatase RsbU (regulator of sigma subunit)/tetratricopeptide (TPR) repeat protein